MFALKSSTGNTIPELVDTIDRLNNKGITVTVDCLGEFVLNEGGNTIKDQILEVMYAIYNHNLDGHVCKISQLGSEFDLDLAYAIT